MQNDQGAPDEQKINLIIARSIDAQLRNIIVTCESMGWNQAALHADEAHEELINYLPRLRDALRLDECADINYLKTSFGLCCVNLTDDE